MHIQLINTKYITFKSVLTISDKMGIIFIIDNTNLPTCFFNSKVRDMTVDADKIFDELGM